MGLNLLLQHLYHLHFFTTTMESYQFNCGRSLYLDVW